MKLFYVLRILFCIWCVNFCCNINFNVNFDFKSVRRQAPSRCLCFHKSLVNNEKLFMMCSIMIRNKFARYHYQCFDNNKKSNNHWECLTVIVSAFSTFSSFDLQNITGKLSEEKNKVCKIIKKTNIHHYCFETILTIQE